MSKRFAVCLFLSLTTFAVVLTSAMADPPSDKKEPKQKTKKREKKAEKGGSESMPSLAFTLKDIDGKEQDLRQYAGKVVLMVNVASQCGFTKQYKGLEALYEKYKDKGLVILGFPANEFGQQEPGTNEEIKSFCASKFNVSFPMFSKVIVKGQDICPLYKYLTSKSAGHKHGGEITWNFNKFLISRGGEVINRFDTRVAPEDEKLVTAIDKAIAESPTHSPKSKEKAKGG